MSKVAVKCSQLESVQSRIKEENKKKKKDKLEIKPDLVTDAGWWLVESRFWAGVTSKVLEDSGKFWQQPWQA